MQAFTRGPRQYAIIGCKASDVSAVPRMSGREIEGAFNDSQKGIVAFLNEASSGLVRISFSFFGWFETGVQGSALTLMSRPAAASLAQQKLAAALPTGGLSQFDGFVAMYNVAVARNATGNSVVCRYAPTIGAPYFGYCQACNLFVDVRAAAFCAASPSGHDLRATSLYTLADVDPGEGVPKVPLGACASCGMVVVRSLERPGLRCPGHAGHDARGNLWAGPVTPAQTGWHACVRCAGVFFASANGCPEGGQHVAGAPLPGLRHDMDRLDFTFQAHEVLHTLGIQHTHGTAVSGGIDDGSPGAYGDNLDIMSAMSVKTRSDARCGSLIPVGPTMAKASAWALGWLRPDRVTHHRASSGESVLLRIADVDEAPPGPPVLALVDDGRAVYAIEGRSKASGWNLFADAPVVQMRRYFGRFASGVDNFRVCTACAQVVHAAELGCPAGDVHDLDHATAYVLPHGSAPKDLPMSALGLGLCSQCNSLAGGADEHGVCLPGGVHRYARVYPFKTLLNAAGNMHSCAKCHAIIVAANATSACGAGGRHKAPKPHYAIPTQPATDATTGLRSCRRCGLLVDVAKFACFARDGKPHTFVLDRNLSVESSGAALTWQVCRDCLALYDTRAPAAADGHLHQPRDDTRYALRATSPALELKWSTCATCRIIYRMGATSSRCPGGNVHTPNPLDYRMIIGGFPRGEGGWDLCSRCGGMFKQGVPGACEGGNPHQAATTAGYRLVDSRDRPFGREPVGQGGFQRCTKCASLHDAPGLCFGDRQGHTAPPDPGTGTGIWYTVPASDDPVRAWRVCKQCHVVVDATMTDAHCRAGGSHIYAADSGYFDVPEQRMERTRLVAQRADPGPLADVETNDGTPHVTVVSITDVQVELKLG